MQQFRESESLQQTMFLIRQQCVYLEKSLLSKREKAEACYLAFLISPAWKQQTTAFSPALSVAIDDTRDKLSRGFVGIGALECRFMDVDILSMLFSGCDETAAQAYCRQLEKEYIVRYCGALPGDAVAIDIFNALLLSDSDVDAASKGKELTVGLSRQQNYLVDVVSRDRNESKEKLFIEAVDQTLLQHHALGNRLYK